jgi:hypothetical protein
MPTITISEETLARLQRIAEPLVDTFDTVIAKLADAWESGHVPAEGTTEDGVERRINPRDLPRLTHTKVLNAAIGGRPVAKPNWNGLLDEMLRRAMKEVKSYEKLRQICPVNIVKGKKTNDGYNHLSDIDISVQGQDANGACRGIVTAAQALGIPLEIGFMWRHKEGAAYPGERARLKVAPNAGKRAA